MLLLRINKTKLFYLYAGLFTTTGWLWFLWSLSTGGHSAKSICIIKNLSGVPCPACGSTNSLILLAEGHWYEALYANPLGYLLAIGLIGLPVWLIADAVLRKASMYNMMHAFDRKIRQKPYLLLLILIPVILNWIWNITKM